MVILAPARTELEEAIAWYDAEQDGLGRRFQEAIYAALQRIQQHPGLAGRMGPGIHRALVKGFPYGVVHEISPDAIVVLAIMHLHRRPEYWKARRQ